MLIQTYDQFFIIRKPFIRITKTNTVQLQTCVRKEIKDYAIEIQGVRSARDPLQTYASKGKVKSFCFKNPPPL